jgi:hypothetical protein
LHNKKKEIREKKGGREKEGVIEGQTIQCHTIIYKHVSINDKQYTYNPE